MCERLDLTRVALMQESHILHFLVPFFFFLTCSVQVLKHFTLAGNDTCLVSQPSTDNPNSVERLASLFRNHARLVVLECARLVNKIKLDMIRLHLVVFDIV